MILRVGAECSGKLSLSLPPVKGFGIQFPGNYACRSDRSRERHIEVTVAVLVPPATISVLPKPVIKELISKGHSRELWDQLALPPHSHFEP
jgi:hypothetical protein